MLRVALIAATALAGLAVAAPDTAVAQSVTGQNCEQAPARQARRSVFGGIASGVIGSVVGSSSAGRAISALVPVTSMLSDAIMNMLDCGEQRKAADATEQLTAQVDQAESQPGQAERSAAVGTTVTWQSDTRPGVSGRSTVTAVERPASPGGQRCMTVTDVVIVDGEETTVPKRMCRTPPETRWARV